MPDALRLAAAGLLVPALAALLAGCADAPQFEARFAPSFGGKRTVAPVGVYRDGRLDADAWERLGLGRALPGTCAPGFGEALHGADPDTFAALDDEARANGLSDELLAKLAAKAKGDTMLLVTVHGRTEGPTRVGAGPRGQQRRNVPPARSGFRPPSPPSGTPADFASQRGELEATAIFFAVPSRERLGAVTMKYAGPDAESAMAEFVRRVAERTDGAACGTWAFGAPAPAVPLPPGGP
jgi:hypothetical protein